MASRPARSAKEQRRLVAGRGGPDQGPRLGRGLHPQREHPAGHGADDLDGDVGRQGPAIDAAEEVIHQAGREYRPRDRSPFVEAVR